jgi:precorrin-6B methylase 1
MEISMQEKALRALRQCGTVMGWHMRLRRVRPHFDTVTLPLSFGLTRVWSGLFSWGAGNPLPMA